MRWARKFLKRRNGRLMRDLAVTYAIGRDEIAVSLARRDAIYGDTPATRREALALVERCCYDDGVPTAMDLDEIDDDTVAEAYAATDRLFPELAGEAAAEGLK